MRQSVEINWELLGAEFAHLDDKQQAKFLYGFAREVMTMPTQYGYEMQMESARVGLNGMAKEKEIRDTLSRMLGQIIYEG